MKKKEYENVFDEFMEVIRFELWKVVYYVNCFAAAFKLERFRAVAEDAVCVIECDLCYVKVFLCGVLV